MRVGLVAHVPDDAVLGRVVEVGQGAGEFDHAQPRAEMAAGAGYGVEQVAAQRGGDFRQLGLRELAQVGRGGNAR